MANDTEAPTSAATGMALAFDTLPDEAFYELQFVTLLRQYHGLHGKLMSEEVAVNQYDFEKEEFNELLGRESVQAALTDKGILKRVVGIGNVRTDSTSDKSKPNGDTAVASKTGAWTKAPNSLSPLQLLVANAMLDLVDQRSYKKKLQDYGVGTDKYQAWLSEPAFNEYMRERAESMLGENQHEAILSLLDKMRMGDMKAVELYLEMTGRYTRVNANSAAGQGQISDWQHMIVSIVEIINDVVEPDTAAIISERIKGLIGANQLAAEVTQAVIEQPEVKQARKLTPQLQALLVHQGGEV